jgi:DNA-binding NtrC family response regulator
MPRRSSSADPANALRGSLRSLTSSLTAGKLMKLREARKTFERDYVRYAISKVGDRVQAARRLGIGLSTLKEKIRS